MRGEVFGVHRKYLLGDFGRNVSKRYKGKNNLKKRNKKTISFEDQAVQKTAQYFQQVLNQMKEDKWKHHSFGKTKGETPDKRKRQKSTSKKNNPLALFEVQRILTEDIESIHQGLMKSTKNLHVEYGVSRKNRLKRKRPKANNQQTKKKTKPKKKRGKQKAKEKIVKPPPGRRKSTRSKSQYVKVGFINPSFLTWSTD